MGEGRARQRLWLGFDILSTVTLRDLGGQDDILREPKLFSTADGIGSTKRGDATNRVWVRGQIASGSLFYRQDQEGGGDAPKGEVRITIHKRDLDRAGLLDKRNQEPLIRINDSLDRVEDRQRRVVWESPENPRMYVEEVDPFVSGVDVVEFTLAPRTETAKV